MPKTALNVEETTAMLDAVADAVIAAEPALTDAEFTALQEACEKDPDTEEFSFI